MNDSCHSSPTILLSLILQSLIQQAMQDNALQYGDFGSKGKNTRDPSHSKGYGKNKGKSKTKTGSDRYHYSQTHHSYAETQDSTIPNFLRTTPEREKLASLSRMTPIIPGISEQKGIAPTSLDLHQGGPKGLR